MIITFYSFGGGTGKSMALANIAVMLGRQHKSTLIVDFDFEAPSLWRYFQDLQPDLDGHDGMLEMLMAQSRSGRGKAVDWHEYVVPLNLGDCTISLITAGKIDDYYSNRMLNFSWTDFYQAGGDEFIELLYNQWAESYDIVLIDSHAGITRTGGICTIALPDAIVPFILANYQSVEGVLRVLAGIQISRQILSQDRPPALVMPILSRIDVHTDSLLAREWLDQICQGFESFYSAWMPTGVRPRAILEKTMLRHVPSLGVGQQLIALREEHADSGQLVHSYKCITQLISTRFQAAAAVAGVVGENPDVRNYLTGHVFISYVREDSSKVDSLQHSLEAAGVHVWRDTADLWPGEDWRIKIRHAITDDALVFLACFSIKSLARKKSYQNEELALAIEQMRLRRPGEPWLIPVRFDDCDIPDLDLGGGRTLSSIQCADILADRFDEGARRLTAAVVRILKPQD